jgi:hypothetical protein
LVEVARSAGALAVLAVGVNVLGQVVALEGDFAEATSLMAEADAVREATGTQVAQYGALVLAVAGRVAADRLRGGRGLGSCGYGRYPPGTWIQRAAAS